jgi:glycosyltransferase involved in cell wall biosynthesis
MINPVGVKGIDTLLAIAAQLPDEPFLLVESWKLGDKALQQLNAQLASLPNVRFQTRLADMREIYRQTRLLLVPSLWEEGFGMVAIEAQSCRIPVIASARGGLVESVGDGGLLIKDYRNVERWLEAIRRELGDQDTYATLSEQAYRHAASAQFSPVQLATQFADICTSEAPRSAPITTRIAQGIRRALHRAPLLHRFLK